MVYQALYDLKELSITTSNDAFLHFGRLFMQNLIRKFHRLLGGLAITLVTPILLSHPTYSATASAPSDLPANEVAKGPTLPTQLLTITTRSGETHRFTVEVAVKPADQARGLMFRKSLADDRGMLFIWPAPRNSVMWMRNTYVPLDMVFIDAAHQVAAIEENTVPLSEALIWGHGMSVAVLELPAMTTSKLGIRVGDKLSYDAFEGQDH